MIRSTSYDQIEILKAAIALHAPGKRIDLDPTFSKGKFYADTGVERPRNCSDIDPQFDFVTKQDVRSLNFKDDSFELIVFDPPFLATTGPSLSSDGTGNKINKRFSVFRSEQELMDVYSGAVSELYRVLRPGGVLIFKCQDKVSSGKQHWLHCRVLTLAEAAGFYAKDLFVLLAKSRIVANWQRQQKHARKYHSYFWVFVK